MSSILDNPELAETGLLALIQAKTDPLITSANSTRVAVVQYAQRWLRLVGDELREEMREGLFKRPRGMECTVTLLGPVKDSKDSHWMTIKTKESMTDDDDEPDPIMMHALILSIEHDIVYYISGYQPDRRGDKFRVIPFDAEALRQARVAPPRNLPTTKQKCIELASASTALQRLHALCSISKLEPSLMAALLDERGGEPVSPWRPLEKDDAAQQKQMARLNPGQRAALAGLDGVSVA